VLTQLFGFGAVGGLGPARATLIANLQPFAAALIALVLLSERMTSLQVVGGLLIGGGILLARRPARVSPSPAAE
jgi:drug/metabolite transporter (DMT)-like permease